MAVTPIPDEATVTRSVEEMRFWLCESPEECREIARRGAMTPRTADALQIAEKAKICLDAISTLEKLSEYFAGYQQTESVKACQRHITDIHFAMIAIVAGKDMP